MPSRPFRLLAAPLTPMHADGSVWLDGVPALAAHLRADGVDGVFVGGSTGEGQSLTVEERVALAARWADTCGALDVIVHVGHNCQRDACRLATHAAELRASGANVVGFGAHSSYYTRPQTPEELVAFCRPIADSAPELPFYYYHIPDLTHVRVPMAAFVELAADAMPNFAGVKYTAGDPLDLQATLERCGDRLELYYGRDEALVAGLAMGVRGAIGSTYKFIAPLFRELIDTDDADRRRKLQRDANRLISTLAGFGYLRAAKALMARRDCACGPPRPPLAPLTADESRRLDAALDALGLLDLAPRGEVAD